jgi:SAM-dependent methyltransferase
MATVEPSQIKLHLPSARDGQALDQDEEWCDVEIGTERRRIRFHDYAAIFDVPGLYEQLFSELLECCSPDVVCELLSEELHKAGVDPGKLAALDFGAGNGLVGERLSRIGLRTIVGIDLLPEAHAAAVRDRPGIYDDYRVLDLNALHATDRAELEGHDFDCLVCVAALGFGDVPPAAFAEAFNLVAPSGWLAFNVRRRFLHDDDPAGFGALIERMLAEGVIEQRARTCYTHRISVSGEPLEYVAIVATKHRDVPSSWVR